MADRTNTQYGPWPSELESLVAQARYRDGWRFTLTDEERDPADTHGHAAGGLTLTITTLTANSYDQRICEACRSTVACYRVRHLFPVPCATFGRQGWLDWLMDCVEAVELHEAREFFRLEFTRMSEVHTENDTVETKLIRVVQRPFAPNHGPGRDPYRRYSYASNTDRRTSFRGEVDGRS